jgi:acetyl-CoA carboxylase biotin carboxylase subunit
MLSKLIVWADTRQEAIKKMDSVLREYIVLGVRTNIGFLRRVMENHEFVRGEIDTGFIERHPELLKSNGNGIELALIAAALAIRNSTKEEVETATQAKVSNWKLFARKLAVSGKIAI